MKLIKCIEINFSTYICQLAQHSALSLPTLYGLAQRLIILNLWALSLRIDFFSKLLPEETPWSQGSFWVNHRCEDQLIYWTHTEHLLWTSSPYEQCYSHSYSGPVNIETVQRWRALAPWPTLSPTNMDNST